MLLWLVVGCLGVDSLIMAGLSHMSRASTGTIGLTQLCFI